MVYSPSMSLTDTILDIVFVGFVLWVLDWVIPMDRKVRRVLQGVVVAGLIVWVLQQAGILHTHIRL